MVDELFEKNQIDIVLCMSYTNVAPFIGYPAATIPIGIKSNNIPIGSYWMGKKYDETTLLKILDVIERDLNKNFNIYKYIVNAKSSGRQI